MREHHLHDMKKERCELFTRWSWKYHDTQHDLVCQQRCGTIDMQQSPSIVSFTKLTEPNCWKSTTARKCAGTTHEKAPLPTQAVVLLSLAYLCDLSIKVQEMVVSFKNMCLALSLYIIVRILRISFNVERNQLNPAVV